MENPEGAVQGNSQNIPTANVSRTFSTFPLKYHLFDTHRFGEYHPHYVEDSVKNDVLPIRSSHNVMSYTLKSPLMQDISMYKDYFSVPMEAILPLNWEKFFDNPVRGDDVAVDVGCTVENFWSKVSSMFTALHSALLSVVNDQTSRQVDTIQCLFRYLVIGEYFYSNGSLMTSLGCHGSPYFQAFEAVNSGNLRYSYDKYFDDLVSTFISEMSNDDIIVVTIDGYNYNVVKDAKLLPGNANIGFRHFLSVIRDNPTFVVQSYTGTGNFQNVISNRLSDFTIYPLSADVQFNTSRLWAYQLCCAHYYSNDHIDFVYSADLFRQLVGSYLRTIYGSGFITSFFLNRNGIRYQYDYLSARGCSFTLSWFTSGSNAVSVLNSNSGTPLSILGYLCALFAYRRSLRYQDYFTGSRAQPLAVGSTGVTVSGNTVDVVDITRNIQRQRFLNAVNRVRHNFEGYLQGIFGGDVPAPDYHNPFFLASTSDNIYGQETENTGSDQFSRSISITTNLRSNGSRYMLEIHSDRPCIVIGITHYDLPRVYGKSMEREFLWKDRFDMFNPFMQYTGDQQVYIQELGINPNGTNLQVVANFSYQLRYAEFKQRFNQACGGFVENLPGFAFLAVDERGAQSTINPDWIRSVTSEFDDFFVSLNGWSNGSYFHFIVDNYNDCSGQRPMAYAPSIL